MTPLLVFSAARPDFQVDQNADGKGGKDENKHFCWIHGCSSKIIRFEMNKMNDYVRAGSPPGTGGVDAP